MRQNGKEYFSVEDVFEIARGLVLTGRAATADTPWPDPMEKVELRWSEGKSSIVTVLDIDKMLARSCFCDGSLNRAILIVRDPALTVPVRDPASTEPVRGMQVLRLCGIRAT